MNNITFINSGGIKLCTGVAGKGPPLLFIGGTGWDLRNPETPLSSPLVGKFSVALFDQRGQGRSDKPTGPYSMVDYANDAVAVADALGWSTFHLVGYSFGGMVAQEVAIRQPNRVDRLVLAASTAGGAGGLSYPVETLLSLSPRDRAREGLLIADTRFKEQLAARPAYAEERILKRILGQTRYMDEPGAREGLAAQLGARALHDCFERLGSITALTLVLAGESDGQAPLDAQRRMASQIKGAQFKVLPGPHDFLFESEQAYLEMIDFLWDCRKV